MEISLIGHASFKLRGKTATVVTDPFDPKVMGIKFPKTTADIVTVSHSHPDHSFVGVLEGDNLVIEGPGEYEVKGVKIWGVPTFHDTTNGKERGKNTVYRMEIDRVSIVHLGDLGHKLTDVQVDSLDGVDILLVPVGGFYTIDGEVAAAISSQLEAKIVIPMHYNRRDLDQKRFGKLAGVDVFLKEMGKSGIIPQPKLLITKEKLPLEPTVVVLE